jgi:protein TonB
MKGKRMHIPEPAVRPWRAHSTPDPDVPDPTPAPVPDDVPSPAHAPVEEPRAPQPPIKAG